MRKRICTLVVFCLSLGLFAACTSSSPARPLDTFVEQLSGLETYTFTAVGALTFENGLDTGDLPLRYSMEGTRSAETGQFSATLHYTDQAGMQLYDMSFLEDSNVTYVRFIPIFQYLMDIEYAEFGAASVTTVFGSRSHLIHPTLDLSNLLTDFPALIRSLDAETIEAGFAADQGGYTLRFTGEYLHTAAFAGLLRPFDLFFDMQTLALSTSETAGRDMLLSPFLTGDREQYTLDIAFARDADAGSFTIWLTLSAPGILTLTADVLYQAADVPPLTPPHDALGVTEVQSLLADYRMAQTRDQSGLEIVYDLPELHMVNHHLGTDILEQFDMEIGDQTFQVSIIANANNTTTSMEDQYLIFSYFPGIMTILYTTLDARSASTAMVPLVLRYISIEDLDAENFHRTPMRVNAHDTAAVTALFYDDNLMGRTLNIYVLQNIAGTDQALSLVIVVILDNMTPQGRQILDRLGFYIGIDFQAYLALASQ